MFSTACLRQTLCCFAALSLDMFADLAAWAFLVKLFEVGIGSVESLCALAGEEAESGSSPPETALVAAVKGNFLNVLTHLEVVGLGYCCDGLNEKLLDMSEGLVLLACQEGWERWKKLHLCRRQMGIYISQ